MVSPVKTKDSELLTGWLGPNGDFFPCLPFEHSMMAVAIIASLFPEEKGGWDSYGALYNHRFVHISTDCSCDMGYSEFRVPKPTCTQIDALYDIYERASKHERAHITQFIQGND